MKTRKSLFKDSSGVSAVTFIVMLAVFFGIMAAVIDLGRLWQVKNELQNAADSAALAGARELFPLATTTGTTMQDPTWSGGQSAATATIQANKADRATLLSGRLEVGYWDTTWPTTSNQALLPTTTSSPDPTHILPAVRVTVTKQAGSNSGPVSLTLGQIFGISNVNVSAKATAVIGYPGTVEPKGLFPIAMADTALNLFYFNNLGTSFKIGSAYHYPTPSDPIVGQWTTFAAQANNDSAIPPLMASGNPNAVTLNGQIWIQPGTEANLFKDANAYKDTVVLLPVVSHNYDLDKKGYTPVLGYVPFYIEAGVGGSGKYIQGHFVSGFESINSLPGGPNEGALTPPRLVQ
jgi:Flp pilus assembly protein TadG